MFLRMCRLAVTFQTWLKSPDGGGKHLYRPKVLKYTKFCCSNVSTSWEIPDAVIDYYRKLPIISGALTFEISSPMGRLFSGGAYFRGALYRVVKKC